MTYFFNLLLGVFLTSFTLGVFSELNTNLHTTLLIFLFWYGLLWLVSYFYDQNHFIKLPLMIDLGLFYFKELVISSFQVAYDILTPKSHMNPGVIALPLEAKTNLEISLLANFITLTPGTLSINISDDRSILYVHALFIENVNLKKVERDLKENFEKRLLKITR